MKNLENLEMIISAFKDAEKQKKEEVIFWLEKAEEMLEGIEKFLPKYSDAISAYCIGDISDTVGFSCGRFSYYTSGEYLANEEGLTFWTGVAQAEALVDHLEKNWEKIIKY